MYILAQWSFNPAKVPYTVRPGSTHTNLKTNYSHKRTSFFQTWQHKSEQKGLIFSPKRLLFSQKSKFILSKEPYVFRRSSTDVRQSYNSTIEPYTLRSGSIDPNLENTYSRKRVLIFCHTRHCETLLQGSFAECIGLFCKK